MFAESCEVLERVLDFLELQTNAVGLVDHLEYSITSRRLVEKVVDVCHFDGFRWQNGVVQLELLLKLRFDDAGQEFFFFFKPNEIFGDAWRKEHGPGSKSKSNYPCSILSDSQLARSWLQQRPAGASIPQVHSSPS